MKTSLLVEKILIKNMSYRGISCRDSDKVLEVYVMQERGMELTEVQIRKFLDMPVMESVRRERQKFQEKGKYLGSPEVMAKRKVKANEVQQNAPSAEAKRLGDIVEGVAPLTRAPKVDDLETPEGLYAGLNQTQIRKYIFKGHDPFNDYIKGQQYELVLKPIAVGEPIAIVTPHRREYKDLKAFSAFWGLPK